MKQNKKPHQPRMHTTPATALSPKYMLLRYVNASCKTDLAAVFFSFITENHKLIFLTCSTKEEKAITN